MANRDLQGHDPMDATYTSTARIDLTRSKPEETDAVSLDEVVTPKKKVIAPTNAAMNAETVQHFDPSTIIPKKEKKDEHVDDLFSALDMAVEREKESISERHAELEAKMYEDHLEQEEANSVSMESVNSPKSVTKATSTDEDDDLYDDDDVYEIPETPKNIKVATTYADPVEKDVEEEAEAPSKFIPKVKTLTKEEVQKPVTIKRSAESELVYDDEELDDDLNEAESSTPKTADDDSDEIIEGLKAAAKQTIRPSIKNIDLSKFTFAKKPVKASSIILKDKGPNLPVADWVMYNSGNPIAMSGLTGPELIKLDPDNSNRNRLNTMKDIYKIIYDHVIDSNKPDFMTWMKQTKYTDVDHMYFALYKATFSGSNFVSYQCPDRKKVFIKEIPFEDMVQYKDDMIKAKVEEILSKSTDVGTTEYDVEMVPAGNYAFGMKTPSLYNVVFETAGLPNNILEKYADLIDTITYIDSVYSLDFTNMEMIPIAIPVVKDDPVKTTIKRIKILYDILKKLGSDEYYTLRGYIARQSDINDEITYKIPAAKCPDCDKEIEENKNVSASGLLFTRHQLGAFASM